MINSISNKLHSTDGAKYGKKRVLIVAYALSPVLGSEYRSAWELTQRLSHDYDVTVLFGDSDGLIGSFANFDSFISQNILPYEAIKIKPSSIQIALARKMRKAPWSLLFVLVLRLWHKKAFQCALRLHAEQPFDVAHQLGPIGFRNPGYLWKLNCHTYWGPIGGAQYINTQAIKRKISTYFIETLLRNFSVYLSARSSYISNAAHGFDRLSFATVENADYFRKYFCRKGPIISDQGLYNNDGGESAPLTYRAKVNVAWAGSLTHRKNVAALTDIIQRADQKFEFYVMGEGPCESEIRELASRRTNLKFKGKLCRTEVMQVLHDCDIILITSLSEANTAILLEGIENNCIPIAPKINGFVNILNDEVAFLIDQSSHDIFVTETLKALSSLCCIETRKLIYKKLRAYKQTLTWSNLAKSHTKQYE